jgi:hypothetical protein
MAIEDLKTDGDMFLSPKIQMRNTLNQSMIPPIKKQEIQTMEHSYSYSS